MSVIDIEAEESTKVVGTAVKPPNAGKGRVKGVPNKTTALLKDALLQAATEAGDGDMVAYLTVQAKTNPGPFMALLGKVLPMQITGVDGGPVHVTRIEIVAPSLLTYDDTKERLEATRNPDGHT